MESKTVKLTEAENRMMGSRPWLGAKGNKEMMDDR